MSNGYDPLEKEVKRIKSFADFDELLGIAKAAILFYMKHHAVLPVEKKGVYAATFVTLTKKGDLRGCIGSLEAYRDINEDVVQNALSAAFGDPRFSPLEEYELNQGIEVEVSILTPSVIFSGTEDEFIRYLEDERPGVIIERGIFRATFLPDVWEQLPNVNEFLEHLSMKAGMPPNGWKGATWKVYKTVSKKKKWEDIDEKPFMP